MRNAQSLEEERRALLEQIHTSRANYRRMLANTDNDEEFGNSHAVSVYSRQNAGFPRSKTVRWIMQHPYLCATFAMATVAIIKPQRIVRFVKNRGPSLSTLTSMTTMAVRDQPKLRMAAKIISVLVGFMQARRSRRM